MIFEIKVHSFWKIENFILFFWNASELLRCESSCINISKRAILCSNNSVGIVLYCLPPLFWWNDII